ncbi:MAG: LysM peptidoglycan-binding domain-containing protein [Polymorphobacter sp.]|uniref:LysM peptidoglycan-binding domain-containing protein n=1 Tax=Polymorphobacter sp. TaxID=1909290 RepID=UPI003A86D95E
MMLLALPMAAPALIPADSAVPWADAPSLEHRARSGDTLARIAARGLQDPDDLALLAEANGLAVDARLARGQRIEVPGALLKREKLGAKVTRFFGEARLAGGTPLAVGMTLSEGDIIETGPNGFVSLEAAGKAVTLPSSSRVKIAALHRVVLSGDVVREFSLLPVREDWLAQLGVRREGEGVALALAEADDAGTVVRD